jgi:hypothetical protein
MCLLLYFQIRDWLTLEEEMLRQQAVVVGDVDDILQVLDKQKVRHSINSLIACEWQHFDRWLEIGAAKCLPNSQLNGVFQMRYCRLAMTCFILPSQTSHQPLQVHVCLK